MPFHNVPTHLTEILTTGPSARKTTQVSNLQTFIQDLFGDDYHTFLQGSYRNHTAIADINDVDIVVLSCSTYSGTHSPHTFETSIPWDAIFSRVEDKLKEQERYRWDISRGDKCIKLKGDIDVDVVPAVKVDRDHTTDPIVIYSFRAGEKVSHPRLHIENGSAKHASTKEQFKPTVRMFKNWKKNHFGDDPLISSHKIEALVHGTDDEDFFADPVGNFLLVGHSISDRLAGLSPTIHSVCGNEDIVRDWDRADRNRFLEQLNHSLAIAHKARKSTNADEAGKHWKEAFNF